MAECNIDKSCFDDVKMCVKVNSVNGIKPNADGEVDIDEKFVTTNTKQTIHGSKTFTNTIKTNGMNREAMLTTMNGLKIDTAPTVINKSSIKWNDKEQNEVSSIEVSRPANTKDTCISLSANTITEWGSNEKASIDVHAKAGAISYATAPTPSSNATGNEIVTAEWVIDKGLADDTNVVHKSGNETIAGSKTFTNQMYLGGCGTSYGIISAKDNNSTLRLFGGSSVVTGANLDLYGEGLESGKFSLRARTSNKMIGLDGSTDGSLKWNGKNIAIDDDNVVHKTGTETIEGTKKFTSDIARKYTAVDITTTPASDMYAHINFTDKNDKTVAYIQYAQKTNGVDYIGLSVRDKNSTTCGVQLNTNKEFAPLGNNSYSLGTSSYKWANVYATTFNGNLKGNADTATSANSVAWSNVTEKPAYITATWRSDTSWYRVWSDGWIEQGGRVQLKTDSNMADKINFPKAFSTNQYTAIISDQAYPLTPNQGTSGEVAIWGTTGYTKTGMFVMSSAGSGRVANWYACGY